MSASERETITILLQAAADLRRRLEAVCGEQGLTFQQYNVLRIIRDAERSDDGPPPTMTVANRLIEPVPGITRMMERLSHKGYLRRERSKDDARVVLCRISRKGLAALSRLDEPIEQVERSALASLPRADQHTLSNLLHIIVAGNASESSPTDASRSPLAADLPAREARE